MKNNILKFYQKFKSCHDRTDEEQEDYPSHQVLIEPIAAEDNYGSIVHDSVTYLPVRTTTSLIVYTECQQSS